MANTRLYRGFRYPREIISHVVWLYFRFSLSFRDIEELMASRGVIVTYETIRQWTLRWLWCKLWMRDAPTGYMFRQLMKQAQLPRFRA